MGYESGSKLGEGPKGNEAFKAPPHTIRVDPSGAWTVWFGPGDFRTMLKEHVEELGLQPKDPKLKAILDDGRLEFDVQVWPCQRGSLILTPDYAKVLGWPCQAPDGSDKPTKAPVEGDISGEPRLKPNMSNTEFRKYLSRYEGQYIPVWSGKDERIKHEPVKIPEDIFDPIHKAHTQGFNEGYSLAQKRGLESEQISIKKQQESHEAQLQKAKSESYATGHRAGFDQGKLDGYNKAKKEASEALNQDANVIDNLRKQVRRGDDTINRLRGELELKTNIAETQANILQGQDAAFRKHYQDGLEAGQRKAAQKLEKSFQEGKAEGLQEAKSHFLKHFEDGKARKDQEWRSLFEALKKDMLADQNFMNLSQEVETFINAILLSTPLSNVKETLRDFIQADSENSWNSGFEEGQKSATTTKAAEIGQRPAYSKEAPYSHQLAPVQVNISPNWGPFDLKDLDVSAMDSKAGDLGAKVVRAHEEAISQALFGKSLTSDKIGAKEAPMSRDATIQEIIDLAQNGLSTPKTTLNKVSDLVKDLEEAAFEAGHDIGYDEGLEDAGEDTLTEEAPEEEPRRSTMSELLGRTLVEGAEAGTRVAVKQLLKLIKEPLIARLAGHLGNDDPSFRARAASFMETDLGEAMLMGTLAMGLGFLPQSLGADKLEALAKELRVSAMTNVGDTVADLLMGPLRQVLSEMVTPAPKALPSESASTVKAPVAVEVAQTEPAPVSARR